MDKIEKSLADAPVIQPVFRAGRLEYLVHGIVYVGSLDEAMDLITDRRVAPRSPLVHFGQHMTITREIDPMTLQPVERRAYTRAVTPTCTCGQADHTKHCVMAPTPFQLTEAELAAAR